MNIYDIAKLSGVSIATVSRVVNGSPRVSEKTKQKVLAVMEESEYTPNVFARGLGLNSMKTIGILCPDISDQYMAEAVSHLEKRLHECGYDCILGCSGSMQEAREHHTRLLLSKRIDALILVGSLYAGSGKDPEETEYVRAAAQQVPVFMINGYVEGENIYCSYGDDRQGAYDVTRALIRRGEEEAALNLCAPAMAAAYRAERDAGRAPAALANCERAVLARLRFLEEADWAALDLGNEGLYRRFARAGRSAASVAELLETVKTKRYPLARLRRMMFRAYLGLPPAPPENPAYLRVLAANKRGGTALLAGMRKTAALPVLTKPAAVRRLGPEAQSLFALEARAGRLYALACPDPAAVPDAWRTGPVIVREGAG